MTHTPIGEGKVSIVIPCHNQGTKLREAVASIEQVRNANLLVWRSDWADSGMERRSQAALLPVLHLPGRSVQEPRE